MISAAGRGLYASSRQKRSRTLLRRYVDLSESDVSLLTRVFSNAPPYDLISTSPRLDAYAKITLELINALPAALVTPPPNKHLFGLFTSDNRQCLVPDPRRRDGRPFRELCSLHSRLQRPLTHSILRFVLDEVTFHMPKLLKLPFAPEQRALFNQLISVTSTYMRPLDFERRWRRAPPREWQRQKNKCAACILTRIGSDANVLVALGAIYRARIPENSYGFQLRTFWYEEWMRAFDARNGEHLVERSRALGSIMNKVVQDARMKARDVDEIDPNASWAKIKPTTALSSIRPRSVADQINVPTNSEEFISTLDPALKQPQFVVKETLAKLSGTWALSRSEKENASTEPLLLSVGPESRPRLDTRSGMPLDHKHLMAREPLGTERVRAGQSNNPQPTYTDYPREGRVQSARGSTLNAIPRSSMSNDGGRCSDPLMRSEPRPTIVDNAPSEHPRTESLESAILPDWVDICGYMNQTPSSAKDVPELSESSTISSSRASSSEFGITDTLLDEALRYSYVDDDNGDDCNGYLETPKAHPQIFVSQEVPLERAWPVTPDTFEQVATQDLCPRPSISTVTSSSVYSFYKGSHGEHYDVPSPPPTKPLHFRKISDEVPGRAAGSKRGSMLLTPSTPRRNPKGKGRLTRQRLASIANTRQRVDSVPSAGLASSGSGPVPKRPSSPSVMRSGMRIGGTEFRQMLDTQEGDDDYIDNHRSTWMREFEWEQPHPATSRVFY